MSVIGIIAMYRWAVSPHVAYLHAVQRLVPAVERMAAENDRIRRSLAPCLRDLQDAQREWADVREGLFTDAEFAAFLRDLPSLIEQTGCTVVVADFTGGRDPASPREDRPDAAFTTRRAGLTVRGTLDQITALLKRLQENRPRVWVDALRMERIAAPPGPARGATAPVPDPEAQWLKCQLTVTAYTLTEPAPAPSPQDGSPVR